MEYDDILDITVVMDESQNIRRMFQPQEGSGWVPNGRYRVFRENSTLLLEITYRDGIVHGRYVAFWSNGRVSTEGQFSDGKQEGIWHFYNKDGTMHAIIIFKEDKEIDSSQYVYNDDGTLNHITQLGELREEAKGEEKEED